MVINQFHAIGDILFLEPMYRHFWNKNGVKPIVPVRDHLMWVQDYIESADFRPMSKFVLDYDSMDTNNPDYLPMRFANQVVRGLKPDDHSDYENTMPDKYILAGLDLDLWKTIKLFFNPDKTTQLLIKLKLFPGTRYILVNEHCQAGKISITPDNPDKIRVIYMETIPGFTVLDWAMVMLMAEENHHVSTCTFFIMQALTDLKGKVFMYARPNDDGLKGISKLKPHFKFTAVE